MVKLTTSVFMLLTMMTLSWTGYRAAVAGSAEPPAAAVQTTAADPLGSDAALRHRQGTPQHWRGYILQQRRF